MRLGYKLFITLLILSVSGTVFAEAKADLDRQLQSLKSSFVQHSQHTPVKTTMDRILLGFTEKTTISLDKVSLSLNGRPLIQHRYQEDENRSLREGGLQPLHELKIPLGRHQLLVSYKGVTPSGKTFEQATKLSINKSNTRKVIELTFSNKANSAPRLSKQEH